MFESREEAAKKLTLKLFKKVKTEDAIVIALPRGAIIMGKIIADYLSLPLDILVVKKIGAPLNPELAIGAIAPKKTVFWNRKIVEELHLSKQKLEELKNGKEKERAELENKLREGKKPLNSKEKTIIIVDDGVATGATVMAANMYFKKKGAKKVILATPVISRESFRELKKGLDEIIALKKPFYFYAVGQFYHNFPQITNKEVRKILR